MRARVDRTCAARRGCARCGRRRRGCCARGCCRQRAGSPPGSFDLATHEALAIWERKNDIFGWGFLGGETLGDAAAPAAALLLETFKRVLAERVADAAGIVEDGSTTRRGARTRRPTRTPTGGSTRCPT